MISLYEIASDYQRALSMEIDSEEDAVALVRLLEEVEGRFEDKAANVVAYIRNLEAEDMAYRHEIDRLKARAEAFQHKADVLKEYLSIQMRRANITECKAGTNQLKFVKNPWKVIIDCDAVLPEVYMTEPKVIPPSPDKTALAKALKAGIAIEGVCLTQDERLKIS